jgi:YfiH family protein
MIRSSLLAGLPGLDHGFTTRLTPAARNQELETFVTTAKQVHKDQFFWPASFERRAHEADGVGTSRANFYVGVYSADCTPVLIAASDPKGEPLAVMAVHAGWRGTALGIAGKALPELQQKLQRTDLRFKAAIGPCIGYSSFEVGADVIAAFPQALAQGLARPLRMEGDKQKFLFDLPGENLRQLRQSAAACGAEIEVDVLGHCTLADAALFPSFRRDRESAGRILSYIAFAAETGASP